jgi:hypothetical protein
MLKPNTPDIPGMSAMTDTLEFMKNLWGGMGTAATGIPAMVMPTLSVEEINKQITDLKAVESWLTMNMNMLRGTIQALEVQSATISALQSMGQTLSSAAGSNAASAATTFPFAQTKAHTPADEKPQAEAASVSAPAPARNGSKRKSANEPKSEAQSGSAAQSASTSASAFATQPGAANMATPLANPAVWWNMLQDQFKQAVSTATSSQAAPPAAKPAPAEPRKRKPRSKS